MTPQEQLDAARREWAYERAELERWPSRAFALGFALGAILATVFAGMLGGVTVHFGA